jgi:hypothetical protein
MPRDIVYEQELIHKELLERDKQAKRARLRYAKKVEALRLKHDKGIKYIKYHLKDPQL